MANKPNKQGTVLPKGKGRKKGSKNKFTNLKDSFLKAYEAEDGFGGDKALIKYAKGNRESFLQMVKGMLPKNVEMKSKNELTIIIKSAIPEPDPPRPGE